MAVSLLFGPQWMNVTQSDLSDLRSTIAVTPDLGFLEDTIRELKSLWPTIVQAYPALKAIPGDKHIGHLGDFIGGGSLPDVKQPGNVLSDTLTVISHIVEFWRLRTKVHNVVFPMSSVLPAVESRLGDAQGFCIGFLTAAAVAGSRNKADFEKYASTAIRIAVCVGAAVELEATTTDPEDQATSVAVGWKSDQQYNEFKKILDSCHSASITCVTDKSRVTVTLSARDTSSFALQLSELGLSVHPVRLRGRYHNPVHKAAVRSLKELFRQDERFWFSAVDRLALPLRSNADAELITAGNLHDIALECILLKPSLWYQNVTAAVATVRQRTNTNTAIFPVGTERVVPSSVTNSEIPKPKNIYPAPVSTHQPRNKIQNGEHTRVSHFNDSAIAIVGMACRYPEADSLEDFWQLISAGKSAVRPVPEDRFSTSSLKREPKGPFWGNFLSNPDSFDHRFFSISGREAKSMDPQQRLLLQVAYEALESSGYFGPDTDTPPTDIGCYIGVGSVDYADNVACHDANAFSALGTLRAFISGRVSHHFGWSGPSITYDTACSSGAVAIHSAITALKAKDCSMAVAGGVNVITSPALFQNLAAASFLNPTGASRAFDAEANGYCRGEGAGIVVLKPLDRAIADGDSIVGVITGSAVNQGSNCSPITVPVSESQSALYRRALSIAGIKPADVTYVEAHGTGTRVGDPIEWESIRKTFVGTQRTQDLFVGSVKDNVGHTESASGPAGLLKTILMMQKRLIPKQANFSRPNPKISLSGSDRIMIAQHNQAWAASSPIAVVNNYGAAGSNAAIVIQEHSSKEPGINGVPAVGSLEYPFFISAKSLNSLQAYCAVLKTSLPRIQEQHGNDALASLAYNLARKQNRSLKYSLAFTAVDYRELERNLDLANHGSSGISEAYTDRRPVVLCFGGQNGCTVSLDETLFLSSRLLQTHLGDCDSACRALGLPGLFPSIFQSEPVKDIVSLHCMLFSLQYASAKSWLDSGVQVDTLIGHSFGQLTALCVAGSLSLLDALRLVSGRAHLIQDFWGPESGEMLSMEGEMENVHGILEQTKRQHPSFSADIACYNGPKNIVIAGTQASIDALEATHQSGSWGSTLKVIRLKNTHAFHSQLVDGIVPSLLQLAATLEFRPPTIRIETCSKGQTWSRIGAEEIVQHSRMPVYFAEAVERTAERLKSSVWIEAGSGSPIISMTRRVLTAQSSQDHVFQGIDLGGSDAQSKLARATGSLWKAGVNTQFWLFHHSQKSTYTWINLPPYQFEKTSHWIDYIEPSASLPADTVKVPPTKDTNELLHLLHRRQEDGLFGVNTASDIFRLCTKGHAVLQQSLCPASMYVEMAVRATSLLVNNNLSSSAPHVQDMKISSPLPLNPDQKVLLQLSRDERENMSWKFTLFSRSDSGSVTYATGSVALFAFNNAATSARFQSLKRLVSQARLEHVFHSPSSNGLKGDVIYKTFGQVVDYEPYYRGVQKIGSNQNEAVGDVSLPDAQPSALAQSACDPITLDNFLQVAGIHVNCLAQSKEGEVSVCTEIGELLLSETFMAKRQDRRSWTVYSNFERTPGNSVTNDIFAFDAATGDLIALLTNIKFHSVPLKSLAKALAKLNGDSGVAASRKSGYSFDTDDIARPVNGNIEPERFISEGRVPTRGDDIQTDQHEVLEQVRELMSNILGVPVQDITLDASPEDLGIDSLLVTEVLGEIKKRFGVTISISDFQQIDNLRTLTQRLQPQSLGARRPVQVPSKAQVKVETSSVSKCEGGSSALTQVQKMLGDVLEIPVSDITPETALSDLGVDSLMVTEVLSEIKKRFHVSLSVERFQDLGDVQSLTDQLRPPRSSHAEQPNGHSADESHISETVAFAVSAHSSFVNVRRNFDAISESVRFAKFWQSVYPAQMELVVAYIVDAFTSLGCPLASLRSGQRLPDISLLTKHSKLKNQLYRILLDQNIIQRDSMDEYVRTNAPTPRTAADVLHKNIISRFPQHISEHELLRSTASNLADCLTGREDPLGLLFGDAKARLLMEDVYTNAPMFKAGTINLAQYLTDAINRSYDGTREVRILELGAGTGGTTRYLVEELSAKMQAKFQYTFTDLSSSLVAAARKKFSEHSFMRYTVMNVEEDPSPQFLGQYDIVISTNCIHATRHLTRSCTNIRKLLRPDGVLCLVELTRNLFWFDLVFGLLEGWWLFEDGRQHALAEEGLWQRHLRQSGYRWIDWTEGDSDESRILRVITASPFEGLPLREQDTPRVTQETVEFKKADDVSLYADIYYPEKVANESKQLPVALMIHGGGHIMLSRKDVRPSQTQLLLDAGFLPVSVDYRLCPETTLLEGPMRDVRDALEWARTTLPKLTLQRPDVRVSGDQVVAVGWSTGGHLALTLGFTSPTPPQAILAFYCPTDYEDPFWSQNNVPFGSELAPPMDESTYDLLEGVYDHPITAYNPPASKQALGGWMAPNDPRSRIALHMNWKGQTLPFLLNGLKCKERDIQTANLILPTPTLEQIQSVSPLSQIRRGNYRTPTFLIHGTQDDLIPWQQLQRTHTALQDKGVIAELRLLEGAIHLFDLYRGYEKDEEAVRAVTDGYKFLYRHVEH